MTITTPTKKAASIAKSPEATAMLRADHKKVSELFEEYEKVRAATKKKTWSRKFVPN